MAEAGKHALNSSGRAALTPSELGNVVSALGEQVLWVWRFGDSQVVLVAPAHGGKAAQLRQCLDGAACSTSA